MLRERPPLTSVQVQTLERIVTDGKRHVLDRIMAGYFLMLAYGRLRFSDGQRITSMRMDIIHVSGEAVGFLECSASRTKTSVSLEKKTRHLPIAIPVKSLTMPQWLPIWDKLRGEQGLMSSEGTGKPFPVMPAPAMGGGWTHSPLAVTPAGEWLRSLLKDTETKGHVRLHPFLQVHNAGVGCSQEGPGPRASPAFGVSQFWGGSFYVGVFP